jgi:hypothetical protein
LSLDLGLLWKKNGVDVGKDSPGGDRHIAQQLVELLIVLDRQGDVPGDDAGFLVVPGGVSGQLENLSAEILQHRGQVDGSTGAHAGGVLALSQVPSDTTDGELQAGLLAARDGGLLVSASALSFSCERRTIGGKQMEWNRINANRMVW